MSVSTTDFPNIGSFTFFDFPNDPRVTAIFVDRSRLELALLPNLMIDRNSTFKFLSTSGSSQNLSWSSTSVHDVLGISVYLNYARQFVHSLQQKNQATVDIHAMVEAELARIRTVRAIHLGQFLLFFVLFSTILLLSIVP